MDNAKYTCCLYFIFHQVCFKFLHLKLKIQPDLSQNLNLRLRQQSSVAAILFAAIKSDLSQNLVLRLRLPRSVAAILFAAITSDLSQNLVLKLRLPRSVFYLQLSHSFGFKLILKVADRTAKLGLHNM